MVRRVLLVSSIALLCVSAAYAANTGRLTGQVLDNNGAVLPGVTVQISSAQLIGGPQAATPKCCKTCCSRPSTARWTLRANWPKIASAH